MGSVGQRGLHTYRILTFVSGRSGLSRKLHSENCESDVGRGKGIIESWRSDFCSKPLEELIAIICDTHMSVY